MFIYHTIPPCLFDPPKSAFLLVFGTNPPPCVKFAALVSKTPPHSRYLFEALLIRLLYCNSLPAPPFSFAPCSLLRPPAPFYLPLTPHFFSSVTNFFFWALHCSPRPRMTACIQGTFFPPASFRNSARLLSAEGSNLHFSITIPVPGPQIRVFFSPEGHLAKRFCLFFVKTFLHSLNKKKKQQKKKKPYHQNIGITSLKFAAAFPTTHDWGNKTQPPAVPGSDKTKKLLQTVSHRFNALPLPLFPPFPFSIPDPRFPCFAHFGGFPVN